MVNVCNGYKLKNIERIRKSLTNCYFYCIAKSNIFQRKTKDKNDEKMEKKTRIFGRKEL